jgi:hypothetical protein
MGLLNRHKELGIEFGKQYRDKPSGIVGRATAFYQYEHGCEHVVLEYVKEGEIKSITVEVPRVEAVAGPPVGKVEKPGGPALVTPPARHP